MTQNREQIAAKANHTASGSFAPGNCANPGGRPKLPDDIKEMCRAAAPIAIKTAVRIIQDSKSNNRDKMMAANIILDRAYGKPTQSVDNTVRMEEAVKIITVIAGDKSE